MTSWGNILWKIQVFDCVCHFSGNLWICLGKWLCSKIFQDLLDNPVASNLPYNGTRPMPSSFKVDVGVNFLRNFHEKMKFPGSIQDHPRKLPRASGHQKTWKIFTEMVLEASGTTLENLQKIIRKHRSERLFGRIFSNFPMLAHVLSLR